MSCSFLTSESCERRVRYQIRAGKASQAAQGMDYITLRWNKKQQLSTFSNNKSTEVYLKRNGE